MSHPKGVRRLASGRYWLEFWDDSGRFCAARDAEKWQEAADKFRKSAEFWDFMPLGRLPDAVIARAAGVTPRAVQNQRAKRNIPNLDYGPGPVEIVIEEPGLTADMIAERAGRRWGSQIKHELKRWRNILTRETPSGTVYFHRKHLEDSWQQRI